MIERGSGPGRTDPAPRQVGHISTGAGGSLFTRRPQTRTPSEAIELTRRLAPDHTNAQIAERLNAAGLRTSNDGSFAATHVQWIRWRHKIPYPTTMARDGELTVSQIATYLGVSTRVIYAWISTDKLTAHRGPARAHG